MLKVFEGMNKEQKKMFILRKVNDAIICSILMIAMFAFILH